MTFPISQFNAHYPSLCSANVIAITSHPRFCAHPAAYLFQMMVESQAGQDSIEERVRALVLSTVLDFPTYSGDLANWRTFAATYFNELPNKIAITKYFERSLASKRFKRDFIYAQAILSAAFEQPERRAFVEVDRALRAPLTIFTQSQALQKYRYPQQDYSFDQAESNDRYYSVAMEVTPGLENIYPQILTSSPAVENIHLLFSRQKISDLKAASL